MTAGDIEAHIFEIYGLSVSDTTIIWITDKTLPVVKEWQQHPLESKSVFLSDDALLKMLCLAMMEITKKWTGLREGWSGFTPSWRFSLPTGWTIWVSDYMGGYPAGLPSLQKYLLDFTHCYLLSAHVIDKSKVLI